MTRITMTVRERFHELAAHRRVVSVARKVLADGETALSVYHKLATDRPGTFLLESSDVGRSWSRWSFIGCDSYAVLMVDNVREATWIGNAPSGAPGSGDPSDALRRTLELLHTELPLTDDASVSKLTSGLVGYFGHDIIRCIEPHLPDTTDNSLQIPELMQLPMEDLATFDHHGGVLWLISNAVNWDGSDEQTDQAYDTACDHVSAMMERLSEPSGSHPAEANLLEPVIRRQRVVEDHMDRIERCKDYIRVDDAFQIVLSQQFETDTQASTFDVYRILRVSSPSSYMPLANTPTKDFSDTAPRIIGSSPKPLVVVQGSEVITNPTMGTCSCGATVEQNNALEANLLAGKKENSKHLMFVDLGRDDLGRVYHPGSVVVHDFRHIKRYSRVMHLISMVTDELSSDATAVGAFAATFPTGTLSGAPRPSALSIINRSEDTRRGVCDGTVGYFGFRGNVDQATTARTGMREGDTVYVQTGGGVISDSGLAAEDGETRNRVATVLRAIATAKTLVLAERSQVFDEVNNDALR